MTAATPWPAALAGTPAVVVIEQAIARQRLSHSLLLHGDDHDTLVAVAHAIADRLLNVPGAAANFLPSSIRIVSPSARRAKCARFPRTPRAN